MNALREAWGELKCLITRLMDAKDQSADSIVVGGLGALLGYTLALIPAALMAPEVFNPFLAGSGYAAILAGMGGGVTMRNKWGQVPENPKPPTEPTP